jgi:tRNA A37 threonylcarbamoyladenosine dehydratase
VGTLGIVDNDWGDETNLNRPGLNCFSTLQNQGFQTVSLLRNQKIAGNPEKKIFARSVLKL